MDFVTVEYQRFGGVTGILAPETKYLRMVGTTQPVEEVSLELAQETLEKAMRRLDYHILSYGDITKLRKSAEHVLTELAPRIRKFLPPSAMRTIPKLYQIDLVTRSFELAQLPFEVLEEPQPGEDPENPGFVITRRVRQRWPRPPVNGGSKPKVLFAWAEPKVKKGSSRRMTVPYEDQMKLLEALLRDWGGEAGGALVPLKNATRKKLAEKLVAGHEFTHVHILAHGVARTSNAEDLAEIIDLDAKPTPATCLALETDTGDMDHVSPTNLADLFSADVPRPASLVLATCGGGEVDPISSGGTLAHALHAAGIPVVVASQLALTQVGSGQLIETFLAALLDGEDPRLALRKCRNALRATRDETYYDRVALVGYIHLEADFEARLPWQQLQVQLARLKAASNEAQKQADEVLKASDPGAVVDSGAVEKVLARFKSVRERLADLKDEDLTKAQKEEAWGLRGSSHKREAESAWRLSAVSSGEAVDSLREHSRMALRDSAVAYTRAAEFSRDNHWTWVQSLALDAVIRGDLSDRKVDWVTSKAASEDLLKRQPAEGAEDKEKNSIAQDAIWACGSLLELNVLAPLLGDEDAEDSQAKACEYAGEIVDRCREIGDDFSIESTLSQLDRYVTWWGADEHWPIPPEIVQRAKVVHAHLESLAKKRK